MKKHIFILFVIFLIAFKDVNAGDGYELWLKYEKVSNEQLLEKYRSSIKAIIITGESETIQIARNELNNGLNGLLGSAIPQANDMNQDGILIAGAFKNLTFLQDASLQNRPTKAGNEGFVIINKMTKGKKAIVITANHDIGVLYGVFNFLKLLQTHQNISSLDMVSSPKMKLRMLNHWDMLNSTHEYSGLLSIWDWHTLPEYIKPVYIDYARANASIGINATSLNCVDADPRFLMKENLIKIKALADATVGFMGPMWREVLMADTWSKGEGSTVAKVIDGSIDNYKISGMAGVANVYRQRNWTGNFLDQANWFTFGQLAWDYNRTSEQIADEWIRMTISNDTAIIHPVKKILMGSRETIVNYQDPIGLNMLTGWGGFRGPWTNNSEHANWNSPYYHRADSLGIGFNRTETGSKAVAQYFLLVAEKFNSLQTCPEKFLL